MKTVLSLSGGMDSTALLAHLLAAGDKVYAISFDYGQKHNVELQRALANIEYLKGLGHNVEHNIVDMSWIGNLFNSALLKGGAAIPEGHYAAENMKQTVVPNRNAIFASIIFGYALSIATKEREPVRIAMGVHSGDHEIYPDCRPEFHTAIEAAFKLGNYESELISYYVPYMQGTKTTILEDAQQACAKAKINFLELFANTNTCYNPVDGQACGKCGACNERVEAFLNIEVPDPVWYVKPYGAVAADVAKVLGIELKE